MIAISLFQFFLIVWFGIAILVTIACLVIIKQHRSKDSGKVVKFDDTEKFYWIDEK